MNKETQPIDRETLLKEANKIIREHEDTLAGIEATGVTQRNGVLVFTGDYFLDEQGLPTAKSTAVFNMFKHLASAALAARRIASLMRSDLNGTLQPSRFITCGVMIAPYF